MAYSTGQLADALLKYGKHTCIVSSKCECGLEEALKIAKEVQVAQSIQSAYLKPPFDKFALVLAGANKEKIKNA